MSRKATFITICIMVFLLVGGFLSAENITEWDGEKWNEISTVQKFGIVQGFGLQAYVYLDIAYKNQDKLGKRGVRMY